jgi:hypothetical protein
MKHATSLRAQITDFFKENPDEWLTMADACIKWERTNKQIIDTVSCIKRDGGIVRTEAGIVKSIWTQNAQ